MNTVQFINTYLEACTTTVRARRAEVALAQAAVKVACKILESASSIDRDGVFATEVILIDAKANLEIATRMLIEAEVALLGAINISEDRYINELEYNLKKPPVETEISEVAQAAQKVMDAALVIAHAALASSYGHASAIKDAAEEVFLSADTLYECFYNKDGDEDTNAIRQATYDRAIEAYEAATQVSQIVRSEAHATYEAAYEAALVDYKDAMIADFFSRE